MPSLLRKVDRGEAVLARSILQASGMNSAINFLPLKEAHACLNPWNECLFLLVVVVICFYLCKISVS